MRRVKWLVIGGIWFLYWAWEIVEVRAGFETFDPEHVMEVVVKLFIFSGIVYLAFRQIEQRNHKAVDTKTYYENIVDNAATGVIAVDREGRITTWNRYMEEEYKIKHTEVMGKNIFEFFSPIQTDGIGQGIRTVLNTGQPLVIDRVRHKTKRVGERIIDFKIYPLKNSLGEIMGVVLLNDDVTEKIKIEEELKTRYEELEKFSKVAVGRELRMIELKKEIDTLLEKLGQPKKYGTSERK